MAVSVEALRQEGAMRRPQVCNQGTTVVEGMAEHDDQGIIVEGVDVEMQTVEQQGTEAAGTGSSGAENEPRDSLQHFPLGKRVRITSHPACEEGSKSRHSFGASIREDDTSVSESVLGQSKVQSDQNGKTCFKRACLVRQRRFSLPAMSISSLFGDLEDEMVSNLSRMLEGKVGNDLRGKSEGWISAGSSGELPQSHHWDIREEEVVGSSGTSHNQPTHKNFQSTTQAPSGRPQQAVLHTPMHMRSGFGLWSTSITSSNTSSKARRCISVSSASSSEPGTPNITSVTMIENRLSPLTVGKKSSYVSMDPPISDVT